MAEETIQNPLELSDEQMQNYVPPEPEPEEKEEVTASTEEATMETQEDTNVSVETQEPEETNESGSEVDNTVQEINYKAEYERIMKPFKANGKTIELKNPDEVIKLMQQGANYTRKMQAIAPHRKLLIMLENNGLLDENKLNYLIDLDKKNPDAIKKLIKDSGVDAIDLSLEDENKQYIPNNYRVDDAAVNFQTALEEVQNQPGGQDTLIEIQKWDDSSKNVLWTNPELMSIINTHRQNGIYNLVSSEVERQRVLGNIPETMSFIEAYKRVGDAMNASAGKQKQSRQPIARGTTTTQQSVRKTLSNNDRVKAAAPTRGTNKTNKSPIVNPLTMSDEEFLKFFDKNRL